MRNLKYLFAGIAVAGLTACGGARQNEVPFDANRVVYDIDSRTGVCFSATGVTETNFLGISRKYDLQANPVSCSPGVLTQVPQAKLQELSNKGLTPVLAP